MERKKVVHTSCSVQNSLVAGKTDNRAAFDSCFWPHGRFSTMPVFTNMPCRFGHDKKGDAHVYPFSAILVSVFTFFRYLKKLNHFKRIKKGFPKVSHWVT